MVSIIQDWLFSELGINFNFDTLGDNNIFQDGITLVNILKKYGLLSSDFVVNPTSVEEECKRNLRLLKPLLDMLKVKYDNEVILGVVDNSPSIVLKLLYELYVCLENKQYLYFITQKNYEKVKTNLLSSNEKNIKSSTVDTFISSHVEKMCFEKPLIQNRDIIEWYKKKYKLVQSSLELNLKRLKERICSTAELNTKHEEEKCSCKYSSNSDIYDTLPDLESFLKVNDDVNILNYDDFITSFKSKQQHNKAKENFEKNIQNDLVNQTWDKVIQRQNEVYNSVFSEILMKQSQYEKQILSKLMQSQKQIEIQNQNLIDTRKKILDEDESHLSCDFQLKEEFEELEALFINEQKRVLQLHRKLYKEKKNLIEKRRLELCTDVMDGLIDIVTNASEYKLKYGTKVPKNLWNNWMQLFYKQKPIHLPFQKLENELLLDEIVNYDEVIAYEQEQDHIVNENDVDEYLLTCGRWFYEDICIDNGQINENVLAFIVHRLLSSKYPPPQSPLPADIPPFRSACVLLNFRNTDCIDKLKLLLTKQCIHVFDTETVIKVCISHFQKETTTPVEEKSKGKKKQSITKASTKKNKDNKEKKKKGKDQTDISNNNKEENIINVNDKETQTSIIKESEDQYSPRTPLGLIGEEVSNVLKNGEQVDDSLLVRVIIEYLKIIEGAEGWLILNFPVTLNQASAIEFALTGKYLPTHDYTLGGNNLTHELKLDEFEEKRKSKLLNYTDHTEDKSSFKTHFTLFLSAKENSVDNLETEIKDPHTESITQNKESGSEFSFKEEKKDISSDILEIFYRDQGIFQHFFFDSLDLKTLKKLARVVLKEDAVEEKNSIDLFGEDCLNKLTKGKKNNKEKKGSTSGKKRKSLEKEKKGGKANVLSTELHNLNQEKISGDDKRNSSEEEENVKLGSFLEHAIKMRVINPGDEDWEFVSLPVNIEMLCMLATIWENIEACYLSTLRNICFENRIANLRLVPYSTYVQKEVNKIINKPDTKQNLVNIFIDYYNNIENDVRTLPDVKSQLHCKIFEMQQSLWQIAEEKKQDIETKRQEIVKENWLINELCLLMNNYLSLVQTEFNRSFESMKLVNDYYLCMLDKNPSVALNVRLSHCQVSKLTVELILSAPNAVKSDIEESDSECSLDSKEKTNELNFIAKCLINCYKKDRVFELLYFFLFQEITKLKSNFETMSHYFYNQIKTESDFLAAAIKKAEKEKNVPSKKGLSPKNTPRKSNKSQSLIKDVSEKDVDYNILKSERLIKEWLFVIDTEINRFNFRLELITKRANENILEFYCHLESVFCDLYSDTLSRYNTEISNINKLCDYLQTAIEEESPIFYPIILNQEKFFVNPNQQLRKKSKDSTFKELIEDNNEFCFTIRQLNNLMNIFRIAGPHGVIRKQPLCYILQDLMMFNAEDNQPHLPIAWNILNEAMLIGVIDCMFGPDHAIDWRDFIIYCLEIPYPKAKEIIFLRNQYMTYDLDETEIISLEDYENVTLWFEEDLPDNPQEGLRIAMIKRLLFDMFKVDANNINFTALLLYFCKDFDSGSGLQKLLSLAVGKNVIMSKEELNEILRNEAEIKKTVTTLINDIVNSIVDNRDGVLIYEVFESLSKYNSDDSGSDYSVSSHSDSRLEEEDSITCSANISDSKTQVDEKDASFFVPIEEISFDKSWVSNIPVTTVINALNASFYCQDKTNNLRNLYLNCIEEEADDEGMIEAHALINLSCMQKLFTVTNKFKISSPCSLLKELVNSLKGSCYSR